MIKLKVKEIRLIYKSEKNIEILVIGSTAFDNTNKLKSNKLKKKILLSKLKENIKKKRKLVSNQINLSNSRSEHQIKIIL